ncbi:hypothetical protein [Sandaracinus amylolyticus]|uniref:Uncharacterized protein n=1 Tax=Sandaracinus amylolyticus TaxID=927083 RepID=A0A0F6W6M4_9BACT|nr:hypothetical protein [Sandaracinus amylolyticus]AKF08767.1 hypothetical protein DB32_005916 [Sandaracinus amylolyticus]
MRIGIAFIVVMGLAACGAARPLVRDASSREITAPSEGRARVVLAMPGAYRDVISVVDERGQYVGQLAQRTFTTLEVEPGTRRFYALVGASAYVVGGTVEAGRTYWVLAETAGFGRPLRWVAWAPTCAEDPTARLAAVRAVEPDPSADRTALDRALGNVPQRILEADRELETMPEAQRTERVLQPACVPGAETTTPSTAEPNPPQ